jgi:hypothetical protein
VDALSICHLIYTVRDVILALGRAFRRSLPTLVALYHVSVLPAPLPLLLPSRYIAHASIINQNVLKCYNVSFGLRIFVLINYSAGLIKCIKIRDLVRPSYEVTKPYVRNLTYETLRRKASLRPVILVSP